MPPTSTATKPDFDKVLAEYAEALMTYSGTELTNYRPFKTLMVEEKINLMADAIVVLIAKTIELRKLDLQEPREL